MFPNRVQKLFLLCSVRGELGLYLLYGIVMGSWWWSRAEDLRSLWHTYKLHSCIPLLCLFIPRYDSVLKFSRDIERCSKQAK